MGGKHWTNYEIKLLRKIYSSASLPQILNTFKGRSFDSIHVKANRLGIIRKNLVVRKWSPLEKLRLKKYYNRLPWNKLMKKFPHRTEYSLYVKASKMGLSRRKFEAQSRCQKITTPPISREFAWWLGALAGDGYVSRGKVGLSVTQRPFADKFANVGKNLFSISPAKRLRIKGKKTHLPQTEVIFYSVNLSNYLGDWHEAAWVNTIKNNFSWLRKKKFVGAFLSSFFDAEGTAGDYRSDQGAQFVLQFASTREEVHRFIIDLLEIVGVRGYSTKTSGNLKLIMISGPSSNKKRFTQIIKSSIPYKQKILSRISSWKPKHVPWTSQEDKLLCQLWRKSNKKEILSALPGRTWYGIENRIRKIHLIPPNQPIIHSCS